MNLITGYVILQKFSAKAFFYGTVKLARNAIKHEFSNND